MLYVAARPKHTKMSFNDPVPRAVPARRPRLILFTAVLRLGLSLWLMLGFFTATAQNVPVDSLLRVWHDEHRSDADRLAALGGVINRQNYLNLTPDSLVRYAQAGYDLAAANDSLVKMVRFLYFQGMGEYLLGEYRSAGEIFQAGLNLAEARNFHERDQGLHNALANIYYRLDNHPRAIEHYHAALRLAEADDDRYRINMIRGNLALLYMELEAYDDALRYILPTIDADSTRITPDLRVLRIYNTGLILMRQGKPRPALDYLLRAAQLVREHQIDAYRGFVLGQVGAAYGELERFDRALSYLHRAYVATDTSDRRTQVEVLTLLGNVYQTMRPAKLDSAYYYLSGAYELSLAVESNPLQKNAASALSAYYEKRGRYREALEMYKIRQTAVDSIYSETNYQAVYAQEATFRYEKEKLEERITYEQRLAEQRLNAQRQKYLLSAGFGLIIFVFGFLFWYRTQRHRQEREMLLHRVAFLKERIAVRSVVGAEINHATTLDKARIETRLGQSIGASSWRILKAIFDNPSITNQEIADAVFLSVEGVSSSLRRMYAAFDVKSQSRGNKKVALVTRAIELSIGEIAD